MTTDPIPAEAPLEDEDLDDIRQAILASYSQKELDRRLRYKWGMRLRDKIGLDVGNEEVVDVLTLWSEDQGRTRELLGLLWSGKPGNPKLRAAAQRLLPDLDAVTERYEGQPPVPPAPEATREALEKVVSERAPMIGYNRFMSGIEAAGAAVCRVETSLDFGTGFLVGRRHVLTNHHVVEKAVKAAIQGERVACRFGYDEDQAGHVSGGLALAAAPGDAWRGPSSRYSQSDVTGTGAPAPDELDFALIRLADDAAEGQPRLVLSPDPPVVAPLDVIFVIQHPHGGTKMIAPGVVTEFPANGLRYRYNATTQPGASGSPVFSADLRLVGLHHAADPAAQPQYNQCVPIWRVARAIGDAGLALDGL